MGGAYSIHTSFDDVFGQGSRHIALPGTTVTELKESSLLTNKRHPEFGLGFEIPYEYCILATGASQASPARPAGPTSREITNYMIASQSAIASSKRVLVVGGGPAGIEFATEVREQYPNVAVTLVQRSDKLMRFAPKAHDKLMPVLEKMGVEVILGDTVVWPDGYTPGKTVGEKTVYYTSRGKAIEAQYVYQATGNVPNSNLVAAIDPSAIAANGCIRIHPNLQVNSTYPQLQHVFAMGDVADVREVKLLSNNFGHGSTVAKNVLSLIAGGQAAKQYKPHSPGSTVTLGKHNSLIYNSWFTFTGWLASALTPKDLHSDQWRKVWSGGKQAQKQAH